jgi:hypothetical protein
MRRLLPTVMTALLLSEGAAWAGPFEDGRAASQRGDSAAAPSSKKPTQTGDPIGTATMLPDGSLQLHLRSVQCDGTIAEGELTIPSSAKNYQDIIGHVGGLKRLESKTVLAWPVAPCPSN